MYYTPFNINTIIQGKIGNILNKNNRHKIPLPEKLSEYTLVKDITPSYCIHKERVGIYENSNTDKFVIKKCTFYKEDLDSIYLRNEAYVLKSLSQVRGENNIFPKFITFVEHPYQIALVTSFEKGKKLSDMSDEIQSLAIENIFTQLKSLSNEIEKKDYLQLPVRNPLFYLFSFPIHAIKNIIKDPAHMSFYMKMSFIFLFNYVSILFEKPKLGLSHRDLFPDNILYSSEDNSLTVLDWESAVISDAMYDLSQLVMIYSKKTNTKKLVKFLKENLDSQYDTERFIALCIFNSLQILGNHSKDNPIFQNTITFMETLHDDIIPGITYKKSPFEIINGITLNLIWYFYKITRLPIHSTKKKLMLCYHSVGNDGWRFSARVNTFKKQVEFLKKKYQLKSLPELLHDTSAGVTISFDDGYLNVFENALPILENAGAHATLFALGEPAKVNRSEIDNPLPIMSEEHILSLKNKGWEIGYHTNTHPNLGKLNDTQLQYEIVEGKKNLEKKLGFTLRYFAYPKGIYNNKVIEYTKKAGFEAAFTVDGKELITKNIDPMLFDRIAIEGNLTMKQFEALISPIGLWVAKIFMKVLVFKEKHLTSYK